MSHAIRIHAHGGPEALVWEAVDVGDPGPGEARVRHTAVGLNFIDVYYRSGLYPAAEMPLILGAEAAGIVEAVGAGVTGLAIGDRVAYVAANGAYSERRLIAADKLIRLPGEVDERTAAAMMLKGMTAQYLLRQTYAVKPGDTILFHAAAGGVGLIAGQWAAHLGATVIGTVGSAEKAELARAHGYHHVIDYRTQNFAEEVSRITGGKGCDAVYDSVGADTFPASLDCLRPRGIWVVFGQSSGPIQPFDIGLLARKGSLYATRPTLFTYTASREALQATAEDLFDVVAGGAVRIAVNQEFALQDAAKAHEALEARRTTGATVLLP